MPSALDTSLTTEIGHSRSKLAGLLLASVPFLVLGFFMIQTTEGSGRYSVETLHAVGYAALGLAGLAALYIVALLFQSGPVVTLSPSGLRDVRISPDIIPWTALAGVGTWEAHGQQVMVLKLHPAAEEKLTLTRMARMTRGANAKLGADGLSVTPAGLAMSYGDLLATTIAYATAHGDPG
jgi:hypothetical protein